jgi:DNA (cytosine-5)-methyltransferase 1
MINHVSLFSGIGGIDLAAQWAGMETVLMVEKDRYCQRVLNKNFPNVPIVKDVRDVTNGTFQRYGINRVDILSGGFPCQPYSVAGLRRGEQDDRAIWGEMLRVIKICKPTWVLGENVVGIVGMALDDVCASLEVEGYETQPVVFPACAVGAWHIRQRVFIVAYAGKHRCWDGKNEYNAITQCSTETDTSINGKTEFMAYANGERQQQPEGVQQESGGWVGNTGANVQYTMCSGRKQRVSISKRGGQGQLTRRFGEGWHGWETEPQLGRVADGIPRRVDRLRALGNAVVPQQVYPVLKGIADFYGGNM